LVYIVHCKGYIAIGSLWLETWLSNGLLTHFLEAARSGAPPKSVLAKACNYTMTLWTRLTPSWNIPNWSSPTIVPRTPSVRFKRDSAGRLAITAEAEETKALELIHE
jgi:hypothetical protein